MRPVHVPASRGPEDGHLHHERGASVVMVLHRDVRHIGRRVHTPAGVILGLDPSTPQVHLLHHARNLPLDGVVEAREPIPRLATLARKVVQRVTARPWMCRPQPQTEMPAATGCNSAKWCLTATAYSAEGNLSTANA